MDTYFEQYNVGVYCMDDQHGITIADDQHGVTIAAWCIAITVSPYVPDDWSCDAVAVTRAISVHRVELPRKHDGSLERTCITTSKQNLLRYFLFGLQSLS